MKIAVVFADSRVVIDGIAYTVTMPSVADNEGAASILWEDDHGTIDMDDGNLPKELNSEAYGPRIYPYVRAWQSAEAEAKKEKEQQEEAMWAMYNSPEALWKRLRKERDKRLSATDYVFEPDYPEITEESMAAVKAYRQALRDLTSQPGAPWTDETVPWPTKPEIVKK